MTDERAVFAVGEGPLLVIVMADAESKAHFLKEGKPEFSVAFTCPDIHNFREYLSEQNVLVDDMQDEDGHYYFYFFDPSGNNLQAHW